MLNLSLDSGNPLPLVDQIVSSVRQQIDNRYLRPGMRLPSIRSFAAGNRVSRFTVVEAYDRLVALGYLSSRQGSGFYVTARTSAEPGAESPAKLERAVDVVWLMRQVLKDNPGTLKVGGGWLPSHWLDEEGIQRHLRTLSRRADSHLTCYGNPLGYAPLRSQLQLRLAELGIAAQPSQFVLTHGASQALDLIVRYLIKPGDAVLVDDPGYYNLFGNLKMQGARLIGVPRHGDGPDMAAMEKLAREHNPKVFFTQSVLHNPTGTDLTPPVAFKVLQLAEKHNFIVVEDDIYADFRNTPVQRLATLDQLTRVIYVSSFSKTLSASLRVGYLACRQDIAEDLADLKMLSCITTSEFNERLVYLMLTEGHYRKYLERLRGRIHRACDATLRNFEKRGLEVYSEPDGGMFLWARLKHRQDSVEIANLAAKEGIMLAPGNVFRPHLEPSPWMRFNVAVCDHPRLYKFLKSLD